MYDTLKHYHAFISSGMSERRAKTLLYALRDATLEFKQTQENAKRMQPKLSLAAFLANLFMH